MYKKLNSQDGQAIIEFIMFVPFMLILYSIILSLASAVNGSINQQKVLRGYYYSRIKHNSTVPSPTMLLALSGVNQAGLAVIGWKERSDGDTPIAPCYEMKSMLNTPDRDTCDDTYVDSTRFIRVRTIYGLCGATYANVASGQFTLSTVSGNAAACTNQ